QRNGEHSQESGNGNFGVVPFDLAHDRDHEAADDDERGRRRGSRDDAYQRSGKKRDQKQRTGDDGGDPAAPARRDAGGAFDVADYGRSPGEGAGDGRARVGNQDAVDAGDLVDFVEEPGPLANRNQSADIVKEIDKEEHENDLEEAETKGSRD